MTDFYTFALGIITGLITCTLLVLIEIRLSRKNRTIIGEIDKTEKKIFQEKGSIFDPDTSKERLHDVVINALK